MNKNSTDIEMLKEMDEILQELENESNDEKMALSAYHEVRHKLGMSSFSAVIRKTGRWTQRICAILFIPAALFSVWMLMNDKSEPNPVWEEVVVPDGQTRQLSLSDGTSVILNSGSRFIYPDKFDGDTREVFFEGEVYARVAKDPDRPFTFHNGDVDLKVKGTTFAFKSYPNSDFSEVTLIEGAVSLNVNSGKSVRTVDMAPGDFVQYNRVENTIEVSSIDVEGYKSFDEDHTLYFRNVPLREIALDLERVFGTRVVILDQSLADTEYLAYFSHGETLDEILNSLNIDDGIDIRHIGGAVYLDLVK